MQIIKDLRKKENMTQQDLANKLGVSIQSVRDYENKMEMVPCDILLKLSDIFQVSIDFLVGKEDEAFLSNFRRLSPEEQSIFMNLIRYIK